jgi:hypothetical protein
MHVHRRLAFEGLAMLVLAFSAQRALAFLDPPYITPANPSAGQPVFVNIYGGECDLVDDGVTWPPPVTQEGNELSILLIGGHQEDPEFCYFGVGTHTYPLGIYSLGHFNLRVNWRYSTFSGWVTQTLGVVPFTVAGVPSAAPVEAHASSGASLVALLAALTGMAWFSLRQRQRQSR